MIPGPSAVATRRGRKLGPGREIDVVLGSARRPEAVARTRQAEDIVLFTGTELYSQHR
jgi:hypothetical protein